MNYACSPFHGSEPGVGWNRAQQAARVCETWAIVEGHEFEADIARYFSSHGPIDGLRFVFVHKLWWERQLAKIPGFYFASYNLWQRRAFRVAKQLDREIDFDIVHQMTMCGYREPGYAWKLGKPFVWGPVGGTQNYPPRFLGIAGLRGAAYESLRSAANWLQLRVSRRVRSAAQVANPVVAANRSIAEALLQVLNVRSIVLSDVGIQQVSGKPRSARPGQPLRLLWSGNLKPFKALPLLLRALATLKDDVPFELQVLGGGPCRAAWERLAKSLGIAQSITWHGRLPHAEALQLYDWADVFVFTSLRDTTGTVIVEALAAGLPVVALDHQGAADVVTDACGIKVPVDRPSATINGLSQTVRALAEDPALCEQLSRGALERSNDYLWSRNGEQMAALYAQAVDSHTDGAVQPEELDLPSLATAGGSR